MFRVPKHRKFDYIPQHYDPAKEELDARMAPYREGGKDAEMAKAGIKTGFNRRVAKNPSYSSRSMTSTLRLLLIIAILVAITIAVLNTTMISDFVKAMES